MSIAKHLGLFLIPVSVSTLGAVWYLQTVNSANHVEPSPPSSAVVDVKQPFTALEYPEVTQLAQLSREWPQAELSQDIGSYLDSAQYNSSTESADAPVAQNQASSYSSEDDLGLSLEGLDLSSLSPDLARKVENAMSQGDSLESRNAPVNDLERNAKQWQGRLPALNLQTHMYTSDANRRWVKINDVEYHQGDIVDGQVTLKEIQPQAVVVEFQGEQIRIPALYEWNG